MTPADATKLLELAPDATAEQIEARFLELRTRLEEKIGKAPTPGLKEKYRASLAQITGAFELLAMNADASALPVLRRDAPPSPPPPAPHASPASATPASRGPSAPPPARRPRKRDSNREMILVTIAAVALLGGGGWWVLSSRSAMERQRLAETAAKEESEHLAKVAKQLEDEKKTKLEAATKLDRDRQDKQLVDLRARMRELEITYENAMRAEQTAARELSDLRSQERDLARDTKAGPAALTNLRNRVRAAELTHRWLEAYLPTNPAKIAKVKADELISSRAADVATEAVELYATRLEELQEEIKLNRADPAVVRQLDSQVSEANRGNVASMNWLGFTYLYARGLPRDEALGFSWSKKAADLGELDALVRVGDAYSEGRGVPKNERAAMEWYLKAAEKGDDYAMSRVGAAYLDGSLLPKNVPLGIDWLKKAAAKGSGYAMWLLADLYLNGNGVPKDEPAGLDYMRQAAKAGDPEAQSILKERKLTW